MKSPGPPATVRRARPADVEDMVRVMWDVAAEGRWLGTEVPFDRDALRFRFLETIERGDAAAFVADTGTPGAPGVVGSLSIRVARYGVADISMALLEGWRGRGLGRALLDAGVRWAAEAGAHKVALEVWPHNLAARALYESAGFVEEGRRRRHYRRANGELWDSILMGRLLR